MKPRRADIVGIISAGLCVVHCLLVPILLIVGVVSGQLTAYWEYLDYVFIALAGTAAYLATRHDSDPALSRWMGGTFLVFTVALLLHDYSAVALYVSVAASFGLAALHLIHYRRRHHNRTVTV